MVAAHMMSGHFYWKNNLIFTLDWNLWRLHRADYWQLYRKKNNKN